MKHTEITVDSNDLRDISYVRYILMGIKHQPNEIDD